MSISDLNTDVNKTDPQAVMNLNARERLSKHEAEADRCWKRAEKLLSQALKPYLSCRRYRVPTTFKAKCQAMYTGRLMDQYNTAVLRAVRFTASAVRLREILDKKSYHYDQTLWRMKELFAQQLYPEICMKQDTAWNSWNIRSIMERYEEVGLGMFEAKVHYYQFSQSLVDKLLNKYPDLNDEIYLPGIRLTALLLTFKTWNETELYATHLRDMLPTDYMYKSTNREHLELINERIDYFLAGIDYNVGVVEFIKINQRS